jgi:hypothetical protein
MEIDAPAQAVAVWIEGDKIMVRLPTVGYAVTNPINAVTQRSLGSKSAANDRRDQSRPGSV